MRKILLTALAALIAALNLYGVDYDDYDNGESVEPYFAYYDQSGTMLMQATFRVLADTTGGPALDRYPTFRKKNAGAFAEWVFVRYERSRWGTTGIFAVTFDIGADGKLRNVQVQKKLDEKATADLVRIVSRSPKWGAALSNGKPVAMGYYLEMVFYGRD